MSEQPATHATAAQNRDDVVKPPMPKWMYSIINPVMSAILRSPFHSVLSNSMMLLSFRGRKSGKRYTIPVGYEQKDNRLYIFSHAGWWKNLPGQAVTLRLRGKDVRATARRLEDPREIAEMVRSAVANRGEKMAERMGLMEYADPEREGPLPQRTKFIELTLEPAT